MGLNSFAQTNAPATEQQGTNKAIVIFQQSIGDQSLLYNGPGYRFLRDLKTNPFYNDLKVTTPGSNVVYKGYRYNNIPLMYDIQRDLVISLWHDNESLYTLHSDQVDEFDLLGHHFIHLRTDSTDASLPKPGFYDDLHTGKVQLLAKYYKILHIVKDYKSDDDQYEYHVQYYLKKNGKYITIGSRSGLISALGDHEAELKKFLKDNRSDSEQDDLAKIATYYDTLTN